MKRKILISGVLILFLFLLQHPIQALNASRDGMKLWLNTLLPTLLPFMILTGILLHTEGIEKIFSPGKKIWITVLGLSPCGSYAFLMGLLCGYPMGAKITSDLYSYGKISRCEAHYLLTFCNNASPAFITSYLAHTCLDNRTDTRQIIWILVLSNLICMLFFRFIIFKNRTVSQKSPAAPVRHTKKETSSAASGVTIIDASIMNGFETITRLGGYILLFSILSACVSYYWPFSPFFKYMTLGITEITTGLSLLASSDITYPIRFLCSMMITAFGGLSILAQTKSVLKNLSILPYLAAKCLNAVLTGILVLFISQIV